MDLIRNEENLKYYDNNIKPQLGKDLGKIPMLGYLLCPIEDIVSGHLITGVKNFIGVTAEDAFSIVLGMTYGKSQLLI